MASFAPTRSIPSPAKTPATISGKKLPSSISSSGKKDEIEALGLILKAVAAARTKISSTRCLWNWIIFGKAGRDIEGVRKCILHAVWQAQGQGCAPGAVGVCIGSDRAHGYVLAKYELFRTLDDVNPNPELAKLESEIMEESNKLGVGPMGFGGKVSLIGCKVCAANRLPASFFVSVAYDCWAYRRLGIRLDASSGAITKWLYRDPERTVEKMTPERRLLSAHGQGSALARLRSLEAQNARA